MKKPYYAHSAEGLPESNWQPLYGHLIKVGDMAAEFAAFFGAQEMARHTGQLHDLGKYTPEFDRRLHGGPSVDHATAGAKIAFERWSLPGKLMAFCIAGHHAGLANGDGEGENRRTLKQRLAVPFGKGVHDIPKLDEVWQQEIPLPEKLPMPSVQFGVADPKDKYAKPFGVAFFTRMLYSCLVDADYLDTEAFYAGVEGKAVQRGGHPDLSQLQAQFNRFIADFRQHAAEKPQRTEEEQRNAALNRLRGEILDHAVAQAVQDKGLFTLTVPTGGGKTFTSMAFALEHAKMHGMRRVIYVIPFTSIIEQNAAAFRKAFGDLGEAAVLEHHSTFDDSKLQGERSKDKLRQASENWDMPIVVTTAVQFFESLFADRSSHCRKLHNISGSVIILDEAQLLPLNLLLPIMQAIKELARNYHCSVVLCTATQPAIQAEHDFYRGLENTRELAPNPPKLFEQLRRITVQHIGTQTDAELLEKLAQHEQILIIVNNRRHARSLYDSAESLDGVFHLTTLMCAKHRAQMLEVIRSRLQNGEPCRVIATSLIEAGVDVDFPLVMRAEAGLDSIAQAGGRCNREGKRPAEDSFVWIFTPEEKWKTPPELGLLAAAMREVVRHHADDLLSPQAIRRYFQRVYEEKGSALDSKRILDMHKNAGNSLDFPFQKIAREFRMIESHMQPLIIPFDAEAEALIERLRHADSIGGILRQLQPYTVQVPESAMRALFKGGLIEAINGEKFGKQFYSLIGLGLYDDVAGFSWDDVAFLRAEELVL